LHSVLRVKTRSDQATTIHTAMPSPSVHKRLATNKKNSQHNKLPATVKELRQLRKAVAESLKQMGEEKDSEQSDSTDDCDMSSTDDDSDKSDMEENSKKSGTEDDSEQSDMEEDSEQSDADRIYSDGEAKQSENDESEEEDLNDDAFDLDEHTSTEREGNSHGPKKNTNFPDDDTSDEELEDSHKEQHGAEQKARWTDDLEASEWANNSQADVTQHKQTGDDSSVEDSELEETEESFAEEQTIHGKITPAWYGDGNKGLLRRRMGIKADLPLQQQNAIVRTLRKLVRTKCGSDLDKSWSTYGRTAQNRMINSMYNTSFML
jgi:hypothetical protein